MRAVVYLEGGGDSKNLRSDCKKAFRRLLESSGFGGSMPRLVACGCRERAYGDFKTAHGGGKAPYVAMLVDSEEPVADPEKTWDHLKACDCWERPDGADDEQVLFMTTCMETWIVADRESLRRHYGSQLQESGLPPLVGLERRSRNDIQGDLEHATRKCRNAYKKGKRSFAVLSQLNPATLEEHLPAFGRMKRILSERLR